MSITPSQDNAAQTTKDAAYDVLIVGAGPAGIAAACEFKNSGLHVLLIQDTALPHHKSCGGMLNKYSLRYLDQRSMLPEGLITDPQWVHFRYYDWDRKIKKPCHLTFCNVDRDLFDEWLLGLLPAEVTVWDHTIFRSGTQNDDGITAHILRQGENYRISCRWLIGCDGARSAVRRIDAQWPQLSFYKTIQQFVEIRPQSIEPFFDCIYTRHIAPDYGYGYIVPKGDVAIVGSVFFPNAKHIHQLHSQALELFSERYPLGRTIAREASVAVQVRSLADIVMGSGRVLLAGEAASLISPTSGEGISFALNSGRLAGQAVVRASMDGRASSDATAADLYSKSLALMRTTIAQRLRFFPVMISRWGKWIGGCMPCGLISHITERL